MPHKLGPRTRQEYAHILTLAYSGADPTIDAPGGHVTDWTEQRRVILRAAVRRALSDRGVPPATIADAIARIPKITGERPRPPRIPTEGESLAYEASATETLPPGLRAVAVLPLALGLRAAEVLSLERADVQRAQRFGELRVMRKGAKEQFLPTPQDKFEALFTELLAIPAALPRSTEALRPRPWKTVGEILAAGPTYRYARLAKLVRKAGKFAGVKVRPHLLRHASATRLMRDGASLAAIQWFLGHSDIKVTMRYVHPGSEDVVKFLRGGMIKT